MQKTLIDLFEQSVRQFANNIFLLEKKSDRFEPTTYQEVKEEVYLLGAGLRALGVEKGDKIALLSEGCNLWIMSELALFYAGAVNVPLSVKLEESNDLLFRLTHAEAKYLFVSVSQLKKIRTIAD
ncbi:MAG: AMP-binding protein, partial [Bacteroidales bacterium]|nr:AMP-binding protein [Bacteroidales bacterium]